MTPTVIVGCPVRARAWIMPRWFDHVETAAAHAGVVPSYLFVVDPEDETVPILRERVEPRSIILNVEPTPYAERQWFLENRLRHMVDLRNLLLREVREAAPDVFLSVDSDVLLAPEAIADLLESTARFPAVGGGTFLTPQPQGPRRSDVPGWGEQFPSCGWIVGREGLRRQYMEHRGVIPVGVIMAVKAMTAAAYAIDYRFSREGEDIGWSVAAGQAGIALGWDNRHPSKHVMSPDALDRVDERCGF